MDGVDVKLYSRTNTVAKKLLRVTVQVENKVFKQLSY